MTVQNFAEALSERRSHAIRVGRETCDGTDANRHRRTSPVRGDRKGSTKNRWQSSNCVLNFAHRFQFLLKRRARPRFLRRVTAQ